VRHRSGTDSDPGLPAFLSSGRGAGRALGLNLQVDSLVDFTLAFVIHHSQPPDLRRVVDMRAAVRLEVQPFDLDDTDFFDALGQQVDLGADQVGDLEGLLAGEEFHPHRARVGDLGVDLLLDLLHQLLPHRLKLKVHAPAERFHVAAGDRCAVVPPDDTAQDVHGGMRAHQLVAAIPVEHAAHRRADLRQRCVALHNVQQPPINALNALHGVYHVVDGQCARVRGLPAASGVEHGTVEFDTP